MAAWHVSAGILPYRIRDGAFEVLLVHPGGPYFANRDEGAWTIPKGEPSPGEDLLQCARREFAEELGFAAAGPFYPLSPVMQRGGKTVHAWACEQHCDPTAVAGNTFAIEWPPHSGRMQEFPEIDRAEFFEVESAGWKINPAQAALIDEAEAIWKRGGFTSGSPRP